MTLTDSHSPKIAVLGSINMDLVIRCRELPAPGETILAESSAEFCGGKGANQAVAAALAGGDVSMIGAVGGDAFANRLKDNMQQHGVSWEAVATCDEHSSGLAVIAVDSRGENSIIVVPGANSLLSPESVQTAESIIRESDCLLIQLEIPLETVIKGIQLARNHGVRIILDPAPVCENMPPILFDVDLICPNETEASALTGLPVTTLDEAKLAAIRLHERGANHVAITMGEKGTLLLNGESSILIPAPKVTAVDTTAAGDAFAGALAVHWSRTENLTESVFFANTAGALAASRPGAQDSIATYDEILELWKNNR